jgi:hypothetical protein
LAWSASENAHTDYAQRIEDALKWLLGFRSTPIQPNPEVYGHNTTRIGWSWVENTHAWVEPTAYAVLALRAGGESLHPRVREGVQLILDRSIPGGGWNYGNPRVYANTLRPFPGPTGIALTALADEPSESRIAAGIAYLHQQLPRIRSPISLAWGLMGLTAWKERPHVASAWLEQCATRELRHSPHAMHDALLLLAAPEFCPRTLQAMKMATAKG